MSLGSEPAAILGARVTHSAPLRWGFAHHTELVTLEDGRRVVVKRFDGADGAAELRRSVALTHRLHAAGIPTPAVLSADDETGPPLLVLSFVEGRTGAEWLDTTARAQTLAQVMGALAERFRNLAVDPADMATGPWAGSSRLAPAATSWLSAIAPKIAPHAGQRRMVEEIRDVIATIPDFYDATEPRLAHGDFVPVNVLLAADGSLAGVLDLGSWRIAHPWLDVAWWGVVVATFHRDAWVTAWPSLLSASGVPGERDATATIRALQVLRSLESAATRNDPPALRLLGTAIAQQIEP
jgi:aminoglycoside phosphotransferase (APT) family kinase protein